MIHHDNCRCKPCSCKSMHLLPTPHTIFVSIVSTTICMYVYTKQLHSQKWPLGWIGNRHIWLAIVSCKACHFRFPNQSSDAKVVGGQSEVLFFSFFLFFTLKFRQSYRTSQLWPLLNLNFVNLIVFVHVDSYKPDPYISIRDIGVQLR